jgi:hypothetical protein
VASRGKRIVAHSVMVAKPEVKRQLGRTLLRWEVKVNFTLEQAIKAQRERDV